MCGIYCVFHRMSNILRIIEQASSPRGKSATSGLSNITSPRAFSSIPGISNRFTAGAGATGANQSRVGTSVTALCVDTDASVSGYDRHLVSPTYTVDSRSQLGGCCDDSPSARTLHVISPTRQGFSSPNGCLWAGFSPKSFDASPCRDD